MEPSYREKREWLNNRSNGTSNYGAHRVNSGYSGQLGQPPQTGRSLGGWAPWSGPNTTTNSTPYNSSTDYRNPAAPQANSLWSRERAGYHRNQEQVQARPTKQRRSWRRALPISLLSTILFPRRLLNLAARWAMWLPQLYLRSSNKEYTRFCTSTWKQSFCFARENSSRDMFKNIILLKCHILNH